MKAVQILGDASSPKITPNDSMPKPIIKGTEILIRVYAAGITGDEVLWPEVYQSASRIPGHDISGVICSLGPEYTGPLEVGQDVYALIDGNRGEGQAEYVTCLANEVAPKPKSISHEEAAALPIPVLTAWQAIIDHGKTKSGMRVLVTGASGAVGTVGVQLANRLVDAHVIALASSHHHAKLKQLGAAEVFDYKTPGWQTQISDVDVVFDTVGGDVLAKTWDTVKGDGAIVTVGDPPPKWAFGKGQADESASHPSVRYVHFIVSPDAERMSKVSEMIDAGSLKALAVKEYPFHEAEMAWAHARERNRGQKIVIIFGGEDEQSN